MKLYVNTDSEDIRLKQIGIHHSKVLPNRELCIGVRHNGSRESVDRATELARLIARAPDLLDALKAATELLSEYCLDHHGTDDESEFPILMAARAIIRQVEGRS